MFPSADAIMHPTDICHTIFLSLACTKHCFAPHPKFAPICKNIATGGSVIKGSKHSSVQVKVFNAQYGIAVQVKVFRAG